MKASENRNVEIRNFSTCALPPLRIHRAAITEVNSVKLPFFDAWIKV